MGLPVRRFGATGWELTTVGLGTWALGGGDWAFGWGPQDDAESIATIHHAVGRPASTGSTPPRSTGSATPRRSSAGPGGDISCGPAAGFHEVRDGVGPQ